MILHGIEYQRPTSLNMRILADHVTYSFLAFMKSIFHFCLGCYCGGYSQNGRSNLSSLNLCSASSISSRIRLFISSWIRRLREFLLTISITSLRWSLSIVSWIFFLHRLWFVLVVSLISDSTFIPSILLAWRICFLFIIYSIGMFPVSLRRIVVGVPFGRYRMVLSASLKIVWSLFLSSLLMSHPSHE